MSKEEKLDRLIAQVEHLTQMLQQQEEPRRTLDHRVTGRAAQAADFERRAREWGLFLQGRGPRPEPIEQEHRHCTRDRAHSLTERREIECEDFAAAVKRARARAIAEWEQKQ